MLITRKVEFEAAHRLEDWDWSPCHRTHGHSWVVEVTWSGQLNAEPNAIVDFAVLKGVLDRAVFKRFDHQNLNEVLNERNVTSEFLAEEIYNLVEGEMKSLRPKYSDLYLESVMVQETRNCWVTYRLP
jgi:6-pyruvoyltetrahydropterin/6-carboxytetrahydropterin synthase